jgi:hypothetical protein
MVGGFGKQPRPLHLPLAERPQNIIGNSNANAFASPGQVTSSFRWPERRMVNALVMATSVGMVIVAALCGVEIGDIDDPSLMR